VWEVVIEVLGRGGGIGEREGERRRSIGRYTGLRSRKMRRVRLQRTLCIYTFCRRETLFPTLSISAVKV
jgi:hypothetical protein